MESTVFNLDAGEAHETYATNARDAVLRAYAEAKGDKNSWNYESKYGHLVRKTQSGWVCGKFWALDDEPYGEVKINED